MFSSVVFMMLLLWLVSCKFAIKFFILYIFQRFYSLAGPHNKRKIFENIIIIAVHYHSSKTAVLWLVKCFRVMLQNLPYFGILQKKLPCRSRSSSISEPKNKLAGKEKNENNFLCTNRSIGVFTFQNIWKLLNHFIKHKPLILKSALVLCWFDEGEFFPPLDFIFGNENFLAFFTWK